MSGLLVLLLIAAVAAGGLRALRLRGGLLTGAMAALAIGASGYALQGHPGLPAAPAVGSSATDLAPLTTARHAFFGQFGSGESWMRMSEALARTGDTEAAVGILSNACQRYPGDAQLWVGLGNALVDHAGMLTPPAELAYRRAAEMAPGNPAGPFFYGLALARSGDPEGAGRVWRSILAEAPPNAGWRPLIEQGVAALNPELSEQQAPGPKG